MTINIISEKEEGNFETDDNPTNAINGKGSNVNVHFNPESNPDIPTLNRKTGRVSNKKRPSQVRLAHEMIHGEINAWSCNRVFRKRVLFLYE